MGSDVVGHARVIGVSGPRITFTVTAAQIVGDEAVEIGSGTHVRVAVDRDRFLDAL